METNSKVDMIINNVLTPLFLCYDQVIVLDTETTGLDPIHDQIIDLGLVVYGYHDHQIIETKQIKSLISLNKRDCLPPIIVKLTGITDEMLIRDGESPQVVASHLAEVLSSNCRSIVLAYNAQFDINFIYYYLKEFGLESALDSVDFLDIMTIYKDRAEYPHRLSDAIIHYGLSEQVVNSHRAYDDAIAAYEVLKCIAQEGDTILNYINLFGYNPKYGVSHRRFAKICYKPQPYNSTEKLYQR